MHSLLDTYLEEVAAHLSALPPAQRTEELREMRTHLENAVIVGQEMGRTEDEAIQAAVAQYGAADVVGQEVTAAWRREQKLNRRSLFGSAACTVAVLYLVSYFIVMAFLVPRLGHFMSNAEFIAYEWTYHVCFGLIVPVSAGIASAVFFSRRAVLGAMLGQAIFQYVWWVYVIFLRVIETHSLPGLSYFADRAYLTADAIAVTLLIAWAVSRLRMVGRQRKYRAAVK